MTTFGCDFSYSAMSFLVVVCRESLPHHVMVRWILPSELDPPLQAPALRARTRASGTANDLKRLPPPRRTPRNLWNTAFSFLRSLEPGCGDAAHEAPLTGEEKSEDRL